MRKLYVMADDQFNYLMEACKPVPYMVFGGVAPTSPQENANAAWRKLGDELGFDYMSVYPAGNDPKQFYANEKVN